MQDLAKGKLIYLKSKCVVDDRKLESRIVVAMFTMYVLSFRVTCIPSMLCCLAYDQLWHICMGD